MKFVPRINLRFDQWLERTATPPAQRQRQSAMSVTL